MISVVVPTLHRRDELARLMESILRQTFTSFEVIIIDQSDDHKTRDLVASLSERVREKGADLIYFYQEEKSSAKARNRGIEEARGNVVTFLDDDMLLFDDYLEQVNSYFERHSEIGGLGGNILVEEKPDSPKSRMRKVLLKLFLLNSFDGRMTASGFGYPIYERQIHHLLKVQLLQTGCMSCSRSFLGNERFDPWFTGYSYREDAEFSYRLSQKAECVMIPEAKLYHLHSSSSRDNLKKRKIMEFKNYYYVFLKHKNKHFYSRLLFCYSVAGILLIDFMGWICNLNGEKLEYLLSDLKAAWSLYQNRRSLWMQFQGK